MDPKHETRMKVLEDVIQHLAPQKKQPSAPAKDDPPPPLEDGDHKFHASPVPGCKDCEAEHGAPADVPHEETQEAAGEEHDSEIKQHMRELMHAPDDDDDDDEHKVVIPYRPPSPPSRRPPPFAKKK